MSCDKKTFQSLKAADKRAAQINSANGRVKKPERLRAYKCDTCGKWHLTSMSEHQYKFTSDVEYRNEIKERSFIKRETEYWSDVFGVE